MFVLGNILKRSFAVALIGLAWSFGSIAAAQNSEATTVVLSAEARALAEQLSGAGPDLAEASLFYAARNYRPLFTADAAVYGTALLSALGDAPKHGLPVARYHALELSQAMEATNDPLSAASAEVLAVQAYLQYAQDLHAGILVPKEVNGELAVHAPREDVTELLSRVVAAADSADLFADLEPKHPRYRMLLAEKARIEGMLSAGLAAPLVEDGAILRPGTSGPRVAQMRARLGAIGFSQGLGSLEIYDDALLEVVKLFQAANGLADDGAVGPRTVAMLNRSDRDLLQQVLVNLERERWLNISRGSRHIQVNIPAFVAQVYDNGSMVFETKTVVGKVGKTQTPEFSDVMTHMMINPSWHVPVSIITKEYLPQLQANNDAMNRQGIQIFYKGRQIDPTRVDFSQFNQSWFPVTMRQPPGAGNALGKVKFLFPNQFDIYLHDTPSKSLFDKISRAFSHGCVRVARPRDLALLLLSRQTDDPEGLFQKHLDSGRETPVYLDQPVPVHLTYSTVWQNAAGQIEYLDDIYGRDAIVYAALEAAGVSIDLPES